MALKYASLGFVEVDGQEIELTQLKVDVNTGRKPVKTINRRQRVKGYAQGIVEYTLSLTVAIPLDGSEPDWDKVDDARVTVEDDKGQRTSYVGCFTTKVGQSYSVDNETTRDIEMVALDKVIE